MDRYRNMGPGKMIYEHNTISNFTSSKNSETSSDIWIFYGHFSADGRLNRPNEVKDETLFTKPVRS